MMLCEEFSSSVKSGDFPALQMKDKSRHIRQVNYCIFWLTCFAILLHCYVPLKSLCQVMEYDACIGVLK